LICVRRSTRTNPQQAASLSTIIPLQYTATATRHGINTLDALITAAAGNPWIPNTA
jgi:hypothetical protein